MKSDPLGLIAGVNTYTYLSSPLSSTDPLGLINISKGIGGASGENSVHANPGPDATIFRPEHDPPHVHLGSNEGPRVSTDTWKPLSDKDAARMTKGQEKFCKGLSDGEKKVISARQSQAFRFGKVLMSIQAGGLLSIAAACRNDPVWCLDQIEQGIYP